MSNIGRTQYPVISNFHRFSEDDAIETSTDNKNEKTANRYARILAKYPYLVSILALIIGGNCCLVFKYREIPNFDKPTNGFEARGTAISGGRRVIKLLKNSTKQHNSLSFYPNYTKFISSFALNSSDHLENQIDRTKRSVDAGEFSRRHIRTPFSHHVDTEAAITSDFECLYEQYDPLYVMKMVFETDNNEDLLQMEHLHAICKIEDELISKLKITRCRMHSLPFYISILYNKHCKDLTNTDVLKFKTLLTYCFVYYKNGHLKKCYNGQCDKTVPTNCTQYDSIYRIFYHLTDVDMFRNESEYDKLSYTILVFRRDFEHFYNISFFEKYLKKNYKIIDNVRITGLYTEKSDKFDIFNEYLLSDMKYFILAMSLILFILMIYLKSIILMIATIISIFLSFVMAYFIYSVILKIELFPFMNLLTLLILIAIGADDVFIFYDSWKQVKMEHADLSFAFRIQRTFAHATLSILVTSLTTSAAFFANYVSNVSAIKCFSLFAGIAVMTNFVLMITWIPGVIFTLEKISLCMSECHCNSLILSKLKHIRTIIANKMLRLSSFILSIVLPKCIEKAWYVFIIVFSICGTAGFIIVFWSPKLKLPTTSEFQLFPASNLIEHYDQFLRSRFQFNIDQEKSHHAEIPIEFIWGFHQADNGNLLDPDDMGILKFEEHFNFTHPNSQIWLSNLTKTIFNESWVDPLMAAGNYIATLDLYVLMMEKMCKKSSASLKSPLVEIFSLCCSNYTIPIKPWLLGKCLPIIYFFSLQINNHLTDKVIFDKDNNIKGYILSIRSRSHFSTSYEKMSDLYEKIDSYHNKIKADAPLELKFGWFSGSSYFEFYDLQHSISSGTYISVALSLAVAFLVMLIVSLNFLITFLAFLTILFAIGVTIGCIVCLGWHLNILESIIISLAVGLSIDHTIHYGVAYRISYAKTRREKVQESFSRVGSAVAMASFTTFLAGVAMLPSSVIAYSKLGIFLMLVMSFSWLYATFFFQSLCYFIGPLKTNSNLTLPSLDQIKTKLCKRKRKYDIMQYVDEGIDVELLNDDDMCLYDDRTDDFLLSF